MPPMQPAQVERQIAHVRFQFNRDRVLCCVGAFHVARIVHAASAAVKTS